MQFKSTPLEGLFMVKLEPFQDQRGLFSRIFCKREFSQAGLVNDFVQVNHSVTNKQGTIRGLHYQAEPFMEVKLIRCVKGSVFDVVVDLRKSSPTYLHYFSTTLSEANDRMIYIPRGFAHGFQTLENDTALIYQHSEFYNPLAERGLRYDDPTLGISWPEEVSCISDKDRAYPLIDIHFDGIQTY